MSIHSRTSYNMPIYYDLYLTGVFKYRIKYYYIYYYYTIFRKVSYNYKTGGILSDKSSSL